MGGVHGFSADALLYKGLELSILERSVTLTSWHVVHGQCILFETVCSASIGDISLPLAFWNRQARWGKRYGLEFQSGLGSETTT